MYVPYNVWIGTQRALAAVSLAPQFAPVINITSSFVFLFDLFGLSHICRWVCVCCLSVSQPVSQQSLSLISQKKYAHLYLFCKQIIFWYLRANMVFLCPKDCHHIGCLARPLSLSSSACCLSQCVTHCAHF